MGAVSKIKHNPSLVQSNKWYEVFEAGTHKDSSGNVKTWSEGELREIASKSNSSKHDVPLVIGHPQANSPAWGWTKKNFQFKDGKLLAQFRDVNPVFAAYVNNKQFPKVSVAIRSDKTLRHIGFLGANPPALPGLEEIQFASDEDGFIYECEFNENGDDEMAVNVKAEVDPKDKEIQELKEAVSAFMEQAKAKDEEIKELKTKAVSSEFAEKARQREEEVVQLKEQLVKFEKEARQKDYSDFCEKELSDKLLPAYKKDVIDFCEILHEVGAYNFSEGGEKSALDKFKDLLKNNLKEHNLFSEVATRDRAVEKPAHKASRYSKIASDKGLEVNEEQSLLHQKTLNYMEKHPDVSYEIAVKKVRDN